MAKGARGPGGTAGESQPEYVKCDALVDFVANCLARRLTKSALKNAVRAAVSTPETPNAYISPRTIETLIKVARERMVARAAEKRGIHKGDAIAFLESVIADDRVHVQHKLSAQEQLTNLMGLDARFELDERKSKAPETTDAVERVRQQLAAMDESVGGEA